MNNKGFISVGVVLLVVLLIGIFGFFSLYNGLKEAEIRVDASYGQVARTRCSGAATSSRTS